MSGYSITYLMEAASLDADAWQRVMMLKPPPIKIDNGLHAMFVCIVEPKSTCENGCCHGIFAVGHWTERLQ